MALDDAFVRRFCCLLEAAVTSCRVVAASDAFSGQDAEVRLPIFGDAAHLFLTFAALALVVAALFDDQQQHFCCSRASVDVVLVLEDAD